MRVLVVAHGFLPEIGGVQGYVYHLSAALQRQGVEVEICFAENSDVRSVERLAREGFSCSVFRKPIPDMLNLFREEDQWVDEHFAALLERITPDVVHVHHLLRLSTNIPRIAKARGGVPVVFSIHDHWLPCARIILAWPSGALCGGPALSKCAVCCHDAFTRFPLWRPARRTAWQIAKHVVKGTLALAVEGPVAVRRFALRNAAMRAMIPHVDRWLLPNQEVAARLGRWGLPASRMVIVPHAVAAGLRRRDARPRRGSPRFGFIGTFGRHKGAAVLLEAFRGTVGAELVLYGPESAALLREFADVVGQGNVTFAGALAESAKAAALAHLDALIAPSVCYETGPLVVAEALVAGVPVICSDAVAMKRWIKEGENGFLVRAGSVSALRDTILRCIQDPALLGSLTPGGDVFEDYDQQAHEIFRPLYANLVGGRSR